MHINLLDESLIGYFSIIKDLRDNRGKLHELVDIFVIAICAAICGCDNWVDIADFGKAKKDWFKSFLKLPNGIPSHDTFEYVFAIISPQEFKRSFLKWIESTVRLTAGEVVAIDGKTLCGSHDHSNGKSAIHMVSA